MEVIKTPKVCSFDCWHWPKMCFLLSFSFKHKAFFVCSGCFVVKTLEDGSNDVLQGCWQILCWFIKCEVSDRLPASSPYQSNRDTLDLNQWQQTQLRSAWKEIMFLSIQPYVLPDNNINANQVFLFALKKSFENSFQHFFAIFQLGNDDFRFYFFGGRFCL